MKQLHVQSPDEQLAISFTLQDNARHQGVPSYKVLYKGRPLLHTSQLGLELEGMPSLLSGFLIKEYEMKEVNEQWEPVYGERSVIADHYNALQITLKESNGLGRKLLLEFRAYNEGIAFQYILPEQDGLGTFVINGERSQFHFPENCYGYEEHGAEGEYHKVLIKDIKPDCERPLTVEYPDGTYVSLAEAGLNDYSRMLLQTDKHNPWVIVSQLSGIIHDYVGYGNASIGLPAELSDEKVRGSTPFATPWRVLIVGDRPGDLLERNYLILNLNAPCELEDPSWIVPGKSLRDVSLSTIGAKACVDMAVQHNFQYVSLDWGWYGDPFDDASDATTLPPKQIWDRFAKDHPGFDLKEIIDYADERGIKIMVYLDRRAVENQIDQFLPIYKEWGIKGIKFGFVNTGPQAWTKWIVDSVRKCAEYGIVVNIHDAYRPTGLSRTLPNLLTQEGIRGNEHMPTARHNTTLPFTRFPAGAGDYTVCYYVDRKLTTHAHQLALAVIVYSPHQSIFWYDAPSDYRGEPETAFFRDVPTVWDDTKVINGEIGEYATIARRSGQQWFVGCINNEEGKQVVIPLNFLTSNQSYKAVIYEDDLDSPSRTKVSIRSIQVNANTVLHAELPASGGTAIHIIPSQGGHHD